VVVDVIDIEYVWFIKAKDNAPVGTNGDGPKSLTLSVQRMQPKSGKVHVSQRSSRVECCKDIAQLPGVFGGYPACVVILKQSLQTFVAKRPYHG